MSNDNNPPTNLLFSPSNNFNFTSNTMFMPVTEQNSTLLCPSKITFFECLLYFKIDFK